MTSYYSKVFKGFSTIAGPMNPLLQKAFKFDWGTRRQGQFKFMKTALGNEPLPAYPNLNAEYILYTDASVCST